MNQGLRTMEFKSRPVDYDEASREFQLFCEAVQSYPDASSRRPSLTFAEYLRNLQSMKELKTASR
jgi:hypothetical protein